MDWWISMALQKESRKRHCILHRMFRKGDRPTISFRPTSTTSVTHKSRCPNKKDASDWDNAGKNAERRCSRRKVGNVCSWAQFIFQFDGPPCQAGSVHWINSSDWAEKNYMWTDQGDINCQKPFRSSTTATCGKRPKKLPFFHFTWWNNWRFK